MNAACTIQAVFFAEFFSLMEKALPVGLWRWAEESVSSGGGVEVYSHWLFMSNSSSLLKNLLGQWAREAFHGP
jgi:hypothetical protein